MKLYTYDREEMRRLFQNDSTFYKQVCTCVCYSEFTSKYRTPNLSMIRAMAEELVIQKGADMFDRNENINSARDAYSYIQGKLYYLGASVPSAPRNPSRKWFIIGIITMIAPFVLLGALVGLSEAEILSMDLVSLAAAPTSILFWVGLIMTILNRPEDTSSKKRNWESYTEAKKFIDQNL